MTGRSLRLLTGPLRGGRALGLLTLAGVALGVGSVLSIQILNRNALGAFAGGMEAVSGEADLSVLGRTSDFPETLFPLVLDDPDVDAAWPLCRLDVAVAGTVAQYLEIIGADLFTAYRLAWEAPPIDPGDPLATRGWAAVSPRLAERMGWKVGDAFAVSSGSRRVELRVGVLVDFQRVAPLASSRMVVMDLAQVQDLFGTRGRLQQIDVRLRDGAGLETVRARLQARLGAAVDLLTPAERKREAAALLSAFRLNLTALSLVSLFVGGFVVYASTQASLFRRRNELGLLRSIGATRSQVLGLLLADATLLGLGGVAAGIPLGWLAAAWNVERVSATLNQLYLLPEIDRLVLPGWLVPLAAAIGIGGALGGALLPALDMSRRDTAALLATYTLQVRARAGALPLLVAGVALPVMAGAAVGLAGPDWKPGGFVLALALLATIPLATPWLLGATWGRLRPRRFGPRYGMRLLGLRLESGTFAVAALGVAVSMLVGVTLMIGSFRRTIEIWIRSTLQADVYVTTESWRRARETAVLDAPVLETLARWPGVAEVDRLRQIPSVSRGMRIMLSGLDMSVSAARARFELLEGDLATALARARDEGAVLITEPLARKAGLGVGGRLETAGPDGPLSFPIAGVAYDYSSEAGGAAMDLETMERAFGPGPIQNVALYLEPGADAATVIGELKRHFAGLPLWIRSNAELRAEVLRIFDQTFAVTRLLQSMSLLVAGCAIALTLLVLARERISELALYRALGATRPQVFRVFLGTGMGIAAMGLSMGAAGGVGLALILIRLVNRAWFGWTIAMHWPWSDLARQGATILAVALAASVYPALGASRTAATELSRENV